MEKYLPKNEATIIRSLKKWKRVPKFWKLQGSWGVDKCTKNSPSSQLYEKKFIFWQTPMTIGMKFIFYTQWITKNWQNYSDVDGTVVFVKNGRKTEFSIFEILSLVINDLSNSARCWISIKFNIRKNVWPKRLTSTKELMHRFIFVCLHKSFRIYFPFTVRPYFSETHYSF